MTLNLDLLTHIDTTTRRWITRSQYDDWQRQAVWDQLQGIRLGQSFCNFFNLRDAFLWYCKDDAAAPHIQRQYLRRRRSD